ncbi:magnesium transporter [Plebeiibacterium marinum]|uniref:Magnesium transporter MgtE n=1 Tax=Plebeiibacterium marinum TaxID=2992111 RepID=A0AAE3MD30_9BACT|nr:magnesium transporter [Plebeiobacterium marinum]MCW3805216.1 magnesium transporter [Plebeiobacterium marinum]
MAEFKLTREFVDSIKHKIEIKDEVRVLEDIKDLHPADIADLYRELELEEAKYLYLIADDETAADVITELDEDERRRLLSSVPSEVIAKRYIDKMDSDDAADVLGEMEEGRQQEVLSHMDDVKSAGDIADLLNYDEDTAGGLMGKELIKVKESWNLPTCLRSMRQQGEVVDEVYYVYVVNNDGVLKGTLSLKRLLLSPTTQTVKDIYNDNLISVNANASAEEVSSIMDKYDLVALPVVDSIGRLLGRITIDDVVDVIREEAEKDYQLASGITDDVESSDSIWTHTRARMPWLIIGLFGGILSSLVIEHYEVIIGLNPQLSFFMVVIAAMGGNTGMQSSAIIVQSLASGSTGLESTSRKLLKELAVAMVNAGVLSTVIFVFNYFKGASQALTYTVSLAMFSVIMIASLFGTFIPLALKNLKIDPAVATGPFVTTLNDILGMLIYFSIGVVCFSMFV